MQWNNGQPFGPPRFFDRMRLRRAALRYAAHGWTVLPGACLEGDRFACGCAGCTSTGCHPAIDSWQDGASADATQVSAWWRRRPYPVLLATGVAFDVLEVPASLGLRALGTTRLHAGVLGAGNADGRGPVAVGPTGRWMFFVRPGGALCPGLRGCLDVLQHGGGSWVPAAPSRMAEGSVRWAVTPDEVHWRLPDPAAVQAVLVDALGALGRRPGGRPVAAARTRTVPRQMSTARRGI
jgi:Bifunctional DNA primase/polymerase, N-terminal